MVWHGMAWYGMGEFRQKIRAPDVALLHEGTVRFACSVVSTGALQTTKKRQAKRVTRTDRRWEWQSRYVGMALTVYGNGTHRKRE